MALEIIEQKKIVTPIGNKTIEDTYNFMSGINVNRVPAPNFGVSETAKFIEIMKFQDRDMRGNGMVAEIETIKIPLKSEHVQLLLTTAYEIIKDYCAENGINVNDILDDTEETS